MRSPFPQTPTQKVTVTRRQQKPGTGKLCGSAYERLQIIVALADGMPEEPNHCCVTRNATMSLDQRGGPLLDGVQKFRPAVVPIHSETQFVAGIQITLPNGQHGRVFPTQWQGLEESREARGCAKVRYYGIWSPTCREQLEQARTLLGPATVAATSAAAVDSAPNSPPTEQAAPVPAPARCPHCHLGQLFEVRVLPPQPKVPP